MFKISDIYEYTNKGIENNWFTADEFKETFDKEFESNKFNEELKELEKSGVIKRVKE